MVLFYIISIQVDQRMSLFGNSSVWCHLSVVTSGLTVQPASKYLYNTCSLWIFIRFLISNSSHGLENYLKQTKQLENTADLTSSAWFSEFWIEQYFHFTELGCISLFPFICPVCGCCWHVQGRWLLLLLNVYNINCKLATVAWT